MGSGNETIDCPAPDCDREFPNDGSARTFIEAGNHGDYEHGDEVEFVGKGGAFVLRYRGEA